MTLIALPLRPLELTDRAATTLLDGLVSMPNIFPLPGTMEERRVIIAAALSNPVNRAWTVWRGSELCGVMLLTDVVPRIDALCHMAFFDRQLLGRRELIWRVMGRAFEELDLQRLSIEIPEHLTSLIRFAQRKLYFKGEGEALAGSHPLIAERIAPYVANPAQWAARLGSRRERAFWRTDTEEWVDCIRLRLLRSEYEAYKEAAWAQADSKDSEPQEPPLNPAGSTAHSTGPSTSAPSPRTSATSGSTLRTRRATSPSSSRTSRAG